MLHHFAFRISAGRAAAGKLLAPMRGVRMGLAALAPMVVSAAAVAPQRRQLSTSVTDWGTTELIVLAAAIVGWSLAATCSFIVIAVCCGWVAPLYAGVEAVPLARATSPPAEPQPRPGKSESGREPERAPPPLEETGGEETGDESEPPPAARRTNLHPAHSIAALPAPSSLPPPMLSAKTAPHLPLAPPCQSRLPNRTAPTAHRPPIDAETAAEPYRRTFPSAAAALSTCALPIPAAAHPALSRAAACFAFTWRSPTRAQRASST